LFFNTDYTEQNHPQRWFLYLLATASFYVFMEEISWGQRIIGFDTPHFFIRIVSR